MISNFYQHNKMKKILILYFNEIILTLFSYIIEMSLISQEVSFNHLWLRKGEANMSRGTKSFIIYKEINLHLI